MGSFHQVNIIFQSYNMGRNDCNQMMRKSMISDRGLKSDECK